MRDSAPLYQIHKNDNVAVALCDLPAGVRRVHGEASSAETVVREDIACGHKLALQAIGVGESVVKYGVVIGVAVRDIEQGEWVHLHNIKSQFDDKSSTLDYKTGVSTDMPYIASPVNNPTKGRALP